MDFFMSFLNQNNLCSGITYVYQKYILFMDFNKYQTTVTEKVL